MSVCIYKYQHIIYFSASPSINNTIILQTPHQTPIIALLWQRTFPKRFLGKSFCIIFHSFITEHANRDAVQPIYLLK